MTATLDGTNGLSFDVGQPIQNVSAINFGYLYGNRIINGAQEIDQVNGGAAVTPASGTLTHATDMFGIAYTQFSKLTFQQVADAPTGLKNSLKITVASQYSPTATDAFYIQTAIEGKDVIDFQLGTSGAATFTLSKWVKSSIAGNYAVAIRSGAGLRSYIALVAVTTSWSQPKVTLLGDVTGTWATDNTAGMVITWDLGSGSNYNGTASTWQAGNFLRTSGSVTFVNQVAGSTLNITGVDCRLGSVAPTVFERRANELQLAQRYFAVIPTGAMQGGAYGLAGNGFAYPTKLPVSMRATPTLTAPTWGTVNTSITVFSAVGAEFVLTSISVTGTGAFAYTNNTNAFASARLF